MEDIYRYEVRKERWKSWHTRKRDVSTEETKSLICLPQNQSISIKL
jgi:hypothetical protein